MAATDGAAPGAITKKKSKTVVNNRHAFDDDSTCKPGVLNFGIGAPSFTMLSTLRPLFAEATKLHMASADSGYMFQYGACRGDQLFVNEVAKFLSERYQDAVDSDDIMCTSGATNGLMILTCLLFKSGDYVFVEDPTYFIALRIFRDDLGLNIVPVPTDADGVRVDVLEKIILEYEDKLGETSDTRPYRAMFYTIPTFHNPTTISLSAERSTALVKILRKFDVLAVCDDVYNLIHFESKPPRRLFSYDKKSDSDYKGNVVSNGSFSKIVGPGLRLGWLEAPEIVIEKIISSGILDSGSGVNQYTSAIMGAALKYGVLSQYFKDIINTCKKNMEVMCDTLDKFAKPYVKYTRPRGGYFVWIQLPPERDGKAFQEYCVKNYKVIFRPGCRFSLNGNFDNCFRLSFAFLEEDDIENGVKTVATALQSFLKQ